MAKYQTLCEFIAELGGMRSIRGNLEMTGDECPGMLA